MIAIAIILAITAAIITVLFLAWRRERRKLEKLEADARKASKP